MKRRATQFIATGLLTVASLAITIIVADIVMRIVGFNPPVSHEWMLRHATSRVANKEIIAIAPKFLQVNYYAVDLTRKTIVTIGDSFTEGYPVFNDYDYPAAMRRLLVKQGCDVNLINMGMGDSGPDQHLRLMRKFVLPRLRPDVVIWQFYPNDIGDNIRQALFDIQSDKLVPLVGNHWLYIRQKIYENLLLPTFVKADSPIIKLLFSVLEGDGDRRIPGGNSKQIDAWSIHKIQLAIEEMDRLSEIHGFAVYYVLVAPQSNYQCNSEDRSETCDDVITAYKHLYEILSDRPGFISAWFGDVRAQPQDVDFKTPPSVVAQSSIFADNSRDSSPGDQHFNEIGYQLLAELVADHVQEHCLDQD